MSPAGGCPGHFPGKEIKMELLNVQWIGRNNFIRGVLRRWYVVLAVLAGLWGSLEIWTRANQPMVIGIALSALAGLLLLFPLLFLANAVAVAMKGIKEKSTRALCPHCFDRFPILYTCGCSTSRPELSDADVDRISAIQVPYLTYLTRGLFLNHCWECSGKFFPGPGSKDQSTLRGWCLSCGSLVEDWELYMLHTGKIIISIEKNLDKTSLGDFPGTWNTGVHHKKPKGGEHYTRKVGKDVQHWFRWGADFKPESMPQHLTENVDYIWLDKKSGSDNWQKTSTILNRVRKPLKDIVFGYMGSEEELQAGGLGIQESKIVYNLSLQDFIEQHHTFY